MKKIALVVLLVCLVSFAAAEDLSSLSFADLLALRSKIEMEIISRPEWKEVTVPSGTWIVGEDIPAGFYSILPTGTGGYITIKDPSQEKEYRQTIVSNGIRDQESAIGKIELKNGYIVEIERGSLIFAPAKGLGF